MFAQLRRPILAGLSIVAILLASLFTSFQLGRADDLDSIVFEGTVRDTAAAVIAGAYVEVRHVTTGVEQSTISNGEGNYRIVLRDPGSYTLRVIASGFAETSRSVPDVTTGRTIAIHFALQPAGVNEQMTVEISSAPLIDTTRTVTGDTISTRELDRLPISNRDPLQLVFLLGGVAEAPLSTADLADEGPGVFVRETPEESGIFSLTGAPATSNNITIDGLDNNDDRGARERITLNPEAIAEVQIITNQYAAEYGRASGGRINIRTRGGEARYGGEAYAFFGDESLNANTFFRNARGLGRLPQRQARAGGVVSGPIRKPHFFFAGFERFDVPDSAEINASLPIQTNPLFPLPLPNRPATPGSPVALLVEEISTPESKNILNLRTDVNLGQSHNLTARFDLLVGSNKRGFPGGSRLPQSILIEGRDSHSISLSDNLVVSARILNQARFQFSRLLPRSSGASDSVGVVIEEPARITAGAFSGSESSPAFAREEKRIQFQDTIALAMGSHQLKLGGDLQLVRSSFTDLFATGGRFTFESVNDFLANRFNRFLQRFDAESRLANDVAGVFVQDEWRIKPNLTLSVGLRWDNESILEDRDNLSPRLAVAWDPFGSGTGSSGAIAQAGRTVVRAGFGVFYNRALLRTLDDFSLGSSALTVDSDIAEAVLGSVQFPSPITDRAIVERFGLRETGFLRRVTPDLEVPYTIQTGLGIERQLGRNLVATLDYIFTRGAHLWRESNINAPVVPSGFSSLTDYMLSRDFDNRRAANGNRPIASSNVDVVRFDLGANTTSSSGAITVSHGVRLLTLGLNAPRSSNITTALNAVRSLRPDPSLTQVELLESSGNSFYNGAVIAVRYGLDKRIAFRGSYTLSKFIDEGTTNTASPQDLSDRRAERSLSLQDQRHRFTFSGSFQLPRLLVELAPIFSFGSSRPFNIGAGFDRNLNDIQNDRPNFIASIERPVWRRPGAVAAGNVQRDLALAPIGSSGNLPRNYGRGPGTRVINLRVSRTFSRGEHIRVRPAVDVFNLFNNSIFSFGSEFIDRDDTEFLVARRTQKPRVIQLNVKVSF
jgi:hypothetical protein